MKTIKRDKILEKLSKEICCIDGHTHAGGIDMYNYQHGRLHMTQNLRDLNLKIELANIKYFVVFPLVSTTYFNTKDFTPTNIDKFPYELSNNALLYESQIFSIENSLIFFAIHPTEKVKEQLASLEKKVSTNLIFGLKFHPLATHTTVLDFINSDFPEFLHIHRLPVTIHSSDFDEYSDPKLVFKFTEQYPDLKACIAHCACFDKEFYNRVNNYENLFVDTSPFNVLCQLFTKRDRNGKLQLNWVNPKEAILELYSLVPNKLIWGTDEPWTCYSNYEGKLVAEGDIFTEKTLLDSLPKAVREKIAYHNTLRFLGG